MDEQYNKHKHYIRIDTDSNIIAGWSDALPFPESSALQREDICINDNGDYQFRLILGGEERPLLRNENGVFLYRYIKGAVVPKTPEEIEAETPSPPPMPPTTNERIDALEFAMITMMMGGIPNV